MKREFLEEHHQHRTMFSDLHRRPNQKPLSPPQTSPKAAKLESSADGATIEVVRRPRGRPPGSKNKPKQQAVAVATRESEAGEPSMSPYMLELPGGIDVVESIGKFCRRRGVGLAVLNGHGVVSNVTLKQPATAHGGTVTFHGRFDILSISATVLPSSDSSVSASVGQFTIFLAGAQGQVVGGVVVGPLTAAGTVYLIAATFNSPTFDRLPPHEETEPAGDAVSRSPVSGGDSGGVYATTYQSSDVIWAPAAAAATRY